ncbi:hypothetical protein FACS1894214_3940 [Planctomycetales bacterium]|nr:hypothetical protein FACS1894214_3940 [Planctomycetales bacterium]
MLLKCMEGETTASVENTQRLFHTKVLPSIDDNILVGNSLIDTDYYELPLEDDDAKKIKPFNWQRAFPQVFKQGGFDAVIGNPPYGAAFNSEAKEYLSQKFTTVADYESSQYFIVLSSKIQKDGAFSAFIVPNTIWVNLFAKKFRQFVSGNYRIKSFADLSEIAVFDQTSVRTTIPVLINNGKKGKITVEHYHGNFVLDRTIKIRQTDIQGLDIWDFQRCEFQALIDNIENDTIPLNSMLEICQGLIPYDKYRGHSVETIKNRIWHADHKKDKTYKKELRGGDVKRYALKWNGKNWISYGSWLAAPRKPDFFTKQRILVREITDGKIHATYTDEEYYNNPSIINCIARPNCVYSLKFLLGIINSRLITLYHFITSPKARKELFPKILVDDIRKIPLPILDLSKKQDKDRYDKIVRHVDRLLQLNSGKESAQTPHIKKQLETEIGHHENEINQLVYQLYGLTDEEIQIIETKHEHN